MQMDQSYDVIWKLPIILKFFGGYRKSAWNEVICLEGKKRPSSHFPFCVKSKWDQHKSEQNFKKFKCHGLSIISTDEFNKAFSLLVISWVVRADQK